MRFDCNSIVDGNGALAKSGKTIYDSLKESPMFFLSSDDLELILGKGLMGLDLNYPLRTRSKVLKSRICEVLGYPVPVSFKKSKPRFPGQDFDTYIQKSNNLQIWNDEIVANRRYVIVRLNELSKVVGVRVVTGEILARLDTTGTLTKKFQAKSREPVTSSVLVSRADAYGVHSAIDAIPDRMLMLEKSGGRRLVLDFKNFLSVDALYKRLLPLVGKRLADPGLDQERNRGAALHKAVCEVLGTVECKRQAVSI
ncbi:MAG: hypothetical protein PHV34_14400 [Verrucomicrobiae bacterium]|nr:hypothetical protein [Verrucomicrobiae bacterium]